MWHGFVANFWENTTLKEFGKLANICQSYEQVYSGTVFFDHCVHPTLCHIVLHLTSVLSMSSLLVAIKILY